MLPSNLTHSGILPTFPKAPRILGFQSFLFGTVPCLNFKDKQQALWLLKKNVQCSFFFPLLCVKNELPVERRARSTPLHVFHAYSQRSSFEKSTAVLLLLEIEEHITNSIFSPTASLLPPCKHRVFVVLLGLTGVCLRWERCF